MRAMYADRHRTCLAHVRARDGNRRWWPASGCSTAAGGPARANATGRTLGGGLGGGDSDDWRGGSGAGVMAMVRWSGDEPKHDKMNNEQRTTTSDEKRGTNTIRRAYYCTTTSKRPKPERYPDRARHEATARALVGGVDTQPQQRPAMTTMSEGKGRCVITVFPVDRCALRGRTVANIHDRYV